MTASETRDVRPEQEGTSLPAPVKAAVTAVLLLPAAVALGVAVWKLRRRLRKQAAEAAREPRTG